MQKAEKVNYYIQNLVRGNYFCMNCRLSIPMHFLYVKSTYLVMKDGSTNIISLKKHILKINPQFNL